MTKRAYVDINFSDKKLALISQANMIIAEYQAAGFAMTLRQLYYQFVARDMMPNSKSSYDKLKSAVSDGRLAGLISWTAIEDRTRGLRGTNSYESPVAALRQLAKDYRRDLWLEQPMRPEVWIEKDALVGVIEAICMKLRVDFFACRGYNSQSEQWRAGRRFASYIQKGQRPIVFHLGDHDPSGLDMTRDNRDRLSLFAGVPVLVQRLALNMEQIERFKPPPNPAKESDARYDDYLQKYGTTTSWELDALAPPVISNLIEEAVLRVRDEAVWEQALEQEVDDRRLLAEIAEREAHYTDDSAQEDPS